MQAEVTLIAVIVLLFLYDLIAGERGRRWFSAVACGLLAVQVLANVVPGTAGEVFGGIFCYVPMHTVVKSVLASRGAHRLPAGRYVAAARRHGPQTGRILHPAAFDAAGHDDHRDERHFGLHVREYIAVIHSRLIH